MPIKRNFIAVLLDTDQPPTIKLEGYTLRQVIEHCYHDQGAQNFVIFCTNDPKLAAVYVDTYGLFYDEYFCREQWEKLALYKMFATKYTNFLITEGGVQKIVSSQAH